MVRSCHCCNIAFSCWASCCWSLSLSVCV